MEKERVKTNMEKWEEAEKRSLDRALDADPGSDEEKQALKQASEIHEILEEDLKHYIDRRESKRKMIWDGLKFVLGGIGCFAAKLYFTSREEQYETSKIDRVMAWEEDGKMPSHTPSKKVFDSAFRRK